MIESIKGILFFGCIHDERQDNFEQCCLRCVSVECCIPPGHQVTESLRTSEAWVYVRKVLEQFRELPIQFPIKSFFEMKQTVYKRKYARSNSDMVRLLLIFLMYHVY